MLTLETKRNDLTLIANSFFAIAAVGGFSVFAYWWSHNAVAIATDRMALFIAIMAVVHGLGAALYMTQDERRDDLQARLPNSWTLRCSVCVAVIQYLFFMLIAALILDGGFILRCFGIGLLAHGCLIAIICLRRPSSPTSLDLGLIRYGFLPIALVVSRAVTFVYQWNGNLPW